MQHTVQHKRVERSALIVGIGANAVMGLAGVAVFLATGIEAIFLDAAITLIALVSGVVAIWISKRSVRTTERFPNGLFALEPVYAIGKAILTIALLAFSLISVSQSALDYVRYGIGEKMTLGPVVYYEIAMVAIGLGLFAYYRRENARIGGSSTLLVAESKATLVDAVISGASARSRCCCCSFPTARRWRSCTTPATSSSPRCWWRFRPRSRSACSGIRSWNWSAVR